MMTGRAYCFDCKREFHYMKLSDGCPFCDGDKWSPVFLDSKHRIGLDEGNYGDAFKVKVVKVLKEVDSNGNKETM